MKMMPAQVPEFEKDKSIYAVDGFCEYMNWACAAFHHMMSSPESKAGTLGLKVDLTVQDAPKLKVVYV